MSSTTRSAAFVGGEDLTYEVKIVGDRPEFTGTYSHVFRGTCRRKGVAIKVLKLVSEQLHTMQRKFRREVEVWTQVKHPNISPFHGYTDGIEPFGPIGALISPWYSNGDATKYLREKGQSLSVDDRIELWRGVVSGVCYLHGQDPQIVHGDLKPGNVLIDDNGAPRICDFGLAHIYLDEGHTDLTTTSPHTGTERYLAPELLEDGARPSTASDVWALGCIGLQFLYSMHPYHHRQNNRTGLLFQDIRQGVLPASQPADTDIGIQACWQILIQCWHLVPNQRPDAQSILLSLPQEFPGSLDPEKLPVSLRQEGSDWFAMYNPWVPGGKSLDIRLLHQFNHESVVCCVKFSRDGRYLATGCNRSAQIFEMKTGALVYKLEDDTVKGERDLYIRDVCFSPDGRYLATGAEDRLIRIWDLLKRRIRTIFEGHDLEIYSLNFSSDGKLIVSASGDEPARIWNLNDGTSTTLSITDPPSNPGNSVGGGDTTMTESDVGSDTGVTSAAISPDDRLVATGSLDTFVRLWDVATGRLLECLRGHKDSVYSVVFTPDGQGLVSGSLDKTLKYWELNVSALRALVDGQSIKQGEKYAKCLSNFVGHTDQVFSVTISHDSQWVVSGSKDCGVHFWNTYGVAQLRLAGHKNSVISVDLSPVGSLLATGSADCQVRVWQYKSLPPLHN